MANNDRIYAAYKGEMGEVFQKQTQERIDWILGQLNGRQKVLDVGCSQGIVSILCAQQGVQVTGVEIQPENVEFAQQLLETEYPQCKEKVHFVNADFLQYQEDQMYDGILVTEVLEHLPDAERFLQHAASFLKPDGVVVITVPFGFCNHPDHTQTFYLSSAVSLVEKAFCVQQIHYGGNWLGLVAKAAGNQSIQLNEAEYQKEEEAFFQIHKTLSLRGEELYQNLMNANRKYKESQEAYQKMKQWHEQGQEKIAELQTKAENGQERIAELQIKAENGRAAAEKLAQFIQQEESQADVLRRARQTIQRLQMENRYLRTENENYKRKLSLITDTWYGKMALKCYKKMKALKAKVKG